MRFRDDTQNLSARIRFIQILILIAFAALAARLYQLQVVEGEYYSERARNQRIRVLPLRAPRGAILDREGRLLVSSRPAYNIVISRDDMKGKDSEALVEPLARGLDVEPEYLRERFDEIKRLPAFESINIKENASIADIVWI
ncbi:MAG TPA: hypothetical protein VF766_00540, partial [Pyrinomonadaceae bacterium]